MWHWVQAYFTLISVASVTVTVTEALVLRPLLGDRGRITESIRILVPVDRMKQKCLFQITTKRVRRSQQFQLRRQPVPCLRCSNRKGSVANSSTCPRHHDSSTRLPHDEARSVDRPGILATDVRRSETYSGVSPRNDLWTSKHSLYWILSATGNQCNSWRAGVTRSRDLRSRTVRAASCRTRWNGASVEAGRPASMALQ